MAAGLEKSGRFAQKPSPGFGGSHKDGRRTQGKLSGTDYSKMNRLGKARKRLQKILVASSKNESQFPSFHAGGGGFGGKRRLENWHGICYNNRANTQRGNPQKAEGGYLKCIRPFVMKRKTPTDLTTSTEQRTPEQSTATYSHSRTP